MPAKMFIMPVPAGNTEALKAAFAEMAGSREGQCVANRGVMGVTREYVCLQHTPQGDVIVVYIEGDNPDKARERMLGSDSEYARWIASAVNPLLARETGEEFPSAEGLADWRA
jgi:hypothetical protein